MRCSTASSSARRPASTSTRPAARRPAPPTRRCRNRPAGVPLGPARLPDRLPQRRQRHHGDDRARSSAPAPTTTMRRSRSTLTSVFINGANETAVAATDPTPFNADPFATVNAAAPNRLTAVTYIGAVRDAADTWYSPAGPAIPATRISGRPAPSAPAFPSELTSPPTSGAAARLTPPPLAHDRTGDTADEKVDHPGACSSRRRSSRRPRLAQTPDATPPEAPPPDRGRRAAGRGAARPGHAGRGQEIEVSVPGADRPAARHRRHRQRVAQHRPPHAAGGLGPVQRGHRPHRRGRHRRRAAARHRPFASSATASSSSAASATAIRWRCSTARRCRAPSRCAASSRSTSSRPA